MAVHLLPAHQRVVFLKPLATSPKLAVGEYIYYDDPDDPAGFEHRNVLYGYGPERQPSRRSITPTRQADLCTWPSSSPHDYPAHGHRV